MIVSSQERHRVIKKNQERQGEGRDDRVARGASEGEPSGTIVSGRGTAGVTALPEPVPGLSS